MWPRFVRRWLVAVILTSSLYILASSALHIESIFQALFDKATRQWITQSLAGSAFWILAFSLMYPIVVFFRGSDNNLYGLEHAILNIDIPPRSMWMNMGYWEPGLTFPDACKRLLEVVLQYAGLLDQDGRPSAKASSARLIDVGFGCGDQTMYLTQNAPGRRALVNHYVGITLNRVQMEYARRRLNGASSDIRLFCADAARPDSWDPELREAARALAHRDSDTDSRPWLLALDTLYHFRPSREPLFTYARKQLSASIMAFDLILSDSVTWLQRLVLRIACLLGSTPWSNFMRADAYRDMLVRAGYDREKIEIHDISERVFPGVAEYIRRRGEELRPFGLGVGRLGVAGRLFGWWGRSGVVLGVIVVAR